MCTGLVSKGLSRRGCAQLAVGTGVALPLPGLSPIQVHLREWLARVSVAVEQGYARLAAGGDLTLCGVVARNGSSRSVGVVKGLGLRGGAYASSFAHDSHNLAVAGFRALERLVQLIHLGSPSHELRQPTGGRGLEA